MLQLSNIQKRIINLIAVHQGCHIARIKRNIMMILLYMVNKYKKLIRLPHHEHIQYPRRDRTIDSYEAQDIEEQFRFRNALQLRQVLATLRIPHRVNLGNGEWFFGEEIFLIGLRRLNYPCKLITLVRTEFGRSVSSLSRAFKYFVLHIYGTFLNKLTTLSPLFVNNFDTYAESIRVKLEELGVPFQQGTYNICGFIDNTNEKTCRPGGGPVAPGGPGAERHPFQLQRGFFSVHKHCHGLKWQTVIFPDGMIGHAFGGLGAKRNDLNDLYDSQLNNLLVNAQVNMVKQHKVYGDGIYHVHLSHICSKHIGNITIRQQLENDGQKSVRESVEWPYADVLNKFAFLDFLKNMKLRLSPVKETYFTSMLLCNIYCILNSNITGSFFKCAVSFTLNEYMN